MIERVLEPKPCHKEWEGDEWAREHPNYEDEQEDKDFENGRDDEIREQHHL